MQPYVLQHAAWQVPAFELEEFAPRQATYCLCIPVINEGERIRRELRRLSSAGLSSLVDVVIADGGSTDGSLDPGFLRDAGVRALLRKTGTGRFGAQVRMALAWALEQDYQGIILIDGNDKDDPAAIPQFIEKLEVGFDHVQGSRFIRGGLGVNTPPMRHYAVRCVHAPLVSLFAHTIYTDTTNGFRAYSATFLLDDRVQPFRDEFVGYEIHYYLAVRAPRLGFRVAEVPVVREYPKTGPVPTTISPIKGAAALLWSTVKACVGTYNPRG
jgi:glycosyltransferase involved in cell wall biosynthesis